MERKFKIVALSVNAGINNKIYESGEVVSESGFAPGSIDELVKGEFIIEMDSKKPKEAPEGEDTEAEKPKTKK